MLSINFWNILWTVVNLLVLYVVFRKFLYQRVMNVIEAREEMVKKQFDDAKKMCIRDRTNTLIRTANRVYLN